MNLPNKLTVARIIATPIFMLSMLLDFKGHYIAALVIFALAAITDALDGNIARSRGLVTDFGKFLDPLADKMLTTAAFLGFLDMHICAGITWIVFIVLFREFAITSLRLICVTNGKVIAANAWGKAKTVSQMVSIVFALFAVALLELLPNALGLAFVLQVVVTIMLWVSTVLAVISGVIYLYDNREAFLASK